MNLRHRSLWRVHFKNDPICILSLWNEIMWTSQMLTSTKCIEVWTDCKHDRLQCHRLLIGCAVRVSGTKISNRKKQISHGSHATTTTTDLIETSCCSTGAAQSRINVDDDSKLQSFISFQRPQRTREQHRLAVTWLNLLNANENNFRMRNSRRCSVTHEVLWRRKKCVTMSTNETRTDSPSTRNAIVLPSIRSTVATILFINKFSFYRILHSFCHIKIQRPIDRRQLQFKTINSTNFDLIKFFILLIDDDGRNTFEMWNFPNLFTFFNESTANHFDFDVNERARTKCKQKFIIIVIEISCTESASNRCTNYS